MPLSSGVKLNALPLPEAKASPSFVTLQAKAIVGLELRLERIDAKRKLTQNRSEADFDGVVEALSGGSPREQAVAAEMRRETRRR